MQSDFDPSLLYNRLPYGTTVPSHCPGLKQLSFDCRVDRSWLEHNFANTPFTPIGDRILVSAADFSNNKAVSFYDVMITAPVEYKGMRGGHPIIEFENLNRTVMGGREKWGYPKLYADISFEQPADDEIRVVVTMGTRKIMEIAWTRDDAVQPQVEPLQLWPHYLLRLLPDASRPRMGFAEVLKRDTSEDLKVLDQVSGHGKIKVASWPEHEMDYCNLAGLEIKEMVSAKLITADWYATDKNGWAHLVDRLL